MAYPIAAEAGFPDAMLTPAFIISITMSDIVRNGPNFNNVLSVELDIRKSFHQFQ